MSDLLVLHEMAERDSKGLMMSPHFVSAQTAKGGGYVTMGVSAEVLSQLAAQPEKYYLALYVIEKDEFNQIKQSK